MHRRTHVVLMLSIALIAFAPGITAAAETIDQSQELGGDFDAFYQPSGCPSAGVKGAAQTFTAGLSGNLTGVDLLLAKASWTTDPKTISIEIHAGTPSGALLATSLPVPAAGIPLGPSHAWMRFSFAAPAPVSAGQVYAIVLPPDLGTYSEVDPTFLWTGVFADAYLNGVTWDEYCSDGIVAPFQSYVFGSDRTFRTYVTPTATPTARASWGALKTLYR